MRVGGEGGQMFELLRSMDVQSLYDQAHRALLLVVTVSSPRVLLRMDERPTRGTTVPLREYLGHKASTLHISRPDEARGVLDVLGVHNLGLECSGHKDPRCLPFFLFERTEANDIASPAGRDAFSDHYAGGAGAGGSKMLDAKGREWSTREFHTADLLHVGGTTLPVGFHWNVATRGRTDLANGWEVWRVGPHGYANVHPNAHIRQGDRMSRIAGPESRRAPRTPRSKRKR